VYYPGMTRVAHAVVFLFRFSPV